ncbi:DUF2088 domain-containing protein, partial [Candidatus Sumerlaeota bacterium]|nr:DUF2088 domain-containing protein [Candidatus Sumerlaeota bacterium]
MSQHMRYGRGTVKVDLAEDGCRGILQPTLPPPIANPNEAITRCLDDPVGSKPLSQIVAGRRKVVVVIPDVTRGEAIQVYLPPLLRYLERHGAGRENVTILTATGAHRTHSDAEREALVGAEAAHGWTVADHDPDSGNDDLEPLDEATPFAVDKRAVESDCLILAGVVSYHYCAGFGGGRKLIAPGLCSRATVQALHRRTLANIDAEGRWRSRTGVLRGNPFHEILERAALRLKPAFALNVALSWDR